MIHCNSIKKILWIASFAFLILSTVNIEGDALTKGTDKLEHVTVATPGRTTSMTRIAAEMAIRQGFYKKEGIDVETVVMKSVILIPALVGGSLDYSSAAPGLIHAAATGVPVKLIFVDATRRPTYLVSRFKTVKELKGKIIGTGGGGENVGVKAVAKHFGLDPEKDITIRALGPGMKIPGLVAGSVDAVHCSIDEKIVLKRRGFTDLFRISDILGSLPQGLGATEKLIKEKRDHVRRMIKATLKGLIYTKGNKARVVEFVMKEWGYDKETSNEGYDEHVLYYTKDGTVDEETIKYQLEEGILRGYKINPLFPPSQTVDFSLIREVKQELGLTS